MTSTEGAGEGEHPDNDGVGPRLLGGIGASDLELNDRSNIEWGTEVWNTVRPRQTDALRLTSFNANNNLNNKSQWLAVHSLVDEEADVLCYQESGSGADDEAWRRELRGQAVLAAEAESKDVSVAAWSSHQTDRGRWVGGGATVTMSRLRGRTHYQQDVRGWGRYGIVTVNGVGRKKLVIVNVYIRNDGEGEDAKLSSELCRKARCAEEGTSWDRWRPEDTPPKPRGELARNPTALLFDDLKHSLRFLASDERVTIVVIGDLNVDMLRGDDDSAALMSMCEILHLAHAATMRHGLKTARRVTTRKGVRSKDGSWLHRPSHIDHCLISHTATVCDYAVDNRTVAALSDHRAIHVDICMRAALGIDENGKAVSTVKRWVARAKWSNADFRNSFGDFAAKFFTKKAAKHGVAEALVTARRTDRQLEAIRDVAKHTAEWSADRWRHPSERDGDTQAAHHFAPVHRSAPIHPEHPTAAALRKDLNTLAERLDAVAIATDKAYVSAGHGSKRNKGRRSGLRRGRGAG